MYANLRCVNTDLVLIIIIKISENFRSNSLLLKKALHPSSEYTQCSKLSVNSTNFHHLTSTEQIVEEYRGAFECQTGTLLATFHTQKLQKIQDQGNSSMKSINCFELKRYMNGRVVAPVEEPTAGVSGYLQNKVWSLGLLALCPRQRVQSPHKALATIRKMSLTETPIWSFHILQDIPESTRRTQQNTPQH